MLACGAGAAHAENEVSYLSQIGISGREVVKQDREVQLSMQVDMSRLRIRTQHTVALTPVLVSEDGSREAAFPPIVIDGGTRNRVYLRAQRLESVELPPYHDESSQVIIRRRNGKEQSYDYCATTPYERWMLDGHIELREEVHGCVNCGEGRSEESLPGSVLPEFIPDYRLDTVAPAPEPVKVRAETRTARLQFLRDSYKILPDLKNNRAELDTVSHSILLVKNNPDVTITGIYITGYASPEGTVAHNLKLSENRALALGDYIRHQDRIDPGLLHVDWKGEDWEGLRAALDRFPGLLKRDEVLCVIDECTGDRDACEKRLQQIEPPTVYQRLLNEVYPLLRRNEYRIVYNVRNFDIEEARRMVDERPDLLSLKEMYKGGRLLREGIGRLRQGHAHGRTPLPRLAGRRERPRPGGNRRREARRGRGAARTGCRDGAAPDTGQYAGRGLCRGRRAPQGGKGLRTCGCSRFQGGPPQPGAGARRNRPALKKTTIN